MSKEEIIESLGHLSVQERQEVRVRLAEIDSDEWMGDGTLSDREKSIIQDRFEDLEKNPGKSLPWDQARQEMLSLTER